MIQSCQLGDNFYDYGQSPKRIKIDDKDLLFLQSDSRIKILDCESCCGCGGW